MNGCFPAAKQRSFMDALVRQPQLLGRKHPPHHHFYYRRPALVGEIIERKNLGVHIPFRKLTAQNLFEAVEKTQTPATLQNAVKMGEQINREEGLKKTIDKLEDYFTIDLKS